MYLVTSGGPPTRSPNMYSEDNAVIYIVSTLMALGSCPIDIENNGSQDIIQLTLMYMPCTIHVCGTGHP